jgi:acyl-CoA dehydrogenase
MRETRPRRAAESSARAPARLNAHQPAVPPAIHAQMYIMDTVLRHGSEEQKQRYLPRIASGELRLQAFGVAEPTGSDTTKLKTRAVRRGDH